MEAVIVLVLEALIGVLSTNPELVNKLRQVLGNQQLPSDDKFRYLSMNPDGIDLAFWYQSFGMSLTAAQALCRSGITPRQLQKMMKEDLLKLRDIGENRAVEILAARDRMNQHFA